MDEILRFDNVVDYNNFNNQETLHPLVSVIDFSKAKRRRSSHRYYGIYVVHLKDVVCGDLKYGKNYYDYQEGTLVFFSPGQVLHVENQGELFQPKGHGVVFHPDLIKGTSLGRNINNYNFFSYSVNEALHLSLRERQIVLDCLAKIQFELEQPVDKHSKKLITTNIELFLDYCQRFYERQFITRDNVNKGILEKFETLLNEYFQSDKPQTIGLPSVAYCADQFNISANYFGDLVKKETGKSAHEYIQAKVIDVAKEKIFDKYVANYPLQ